MSEVEKLYELAEIKKQYCGWLDMGDLDCQMQYVTCNSISEWKEAVFSSRFSESEEEPELKYPPFTAEKQLELIKWLAKRQDFGLNYYPNSEVWDAQTQFSWESYCKTYEHEEFEQALAGLINILWQDLKEEEKETIRGILRT